MIMNRTEYKSINRTDFKQLYGYKKDYYRDIAVIRFQEEIAQMKRLRPDTAVVMHHTNSNDDNYELWNQVVPMYNDYHTRLHKLVITDEARRKISKMHKGKVLSEATKAKISATKKMQAAKLRAETGYAMSPEQRQKVSEAAKRQWQRIKLNKVAEV